MASTERFASTFWTLVGAIVVVVVALVGFAISQNDVVGPKTASNGPAREAPGTTPAIKPHPAPATGAP